MQGEPTGLGDAICLTVRGAFGGPTMHQIPWADPTGAAGVAGRPIGLPCCQSWYIPPHISGSGPNCAPADPEIPAKTPIDRIAAVTALRI